MKNIAFTDQALAFLNAQTLIVRQKFLTVIEELKENGRIAEPFGKVIAPNLFEIRIRESSGQYRMFYCYFNPEGVLVLSGYVKKTQKAPLREIRKAQKIRKSNLGV